MALVFISHSFHDESLARLIKEALADAGHSSWIAEDDIRTGESIPDAVARALSRCDFVVVCLSEKAVNSPWVKDELDKAIMRQFRDKTHRVLPVRLESVAPPPCIQNLLYVDLHPKASQWDQGLAKLIADLNYYSTQSASPPPVEADSIPESLIVAQQTPQQKSEASPQYEEIPDHEWIMPYNSSWDGSYDDQRRIPIKERKKRWEEYEKYLEEERRRKNT